MRIYHAKLVTMETPMYPDDTCPMGWVEVADGHITDMGFGECPIDSEDIDANGGYLLPGFLDIHTHIGIIEDGIDFEGDDCNEATDPFSPQLRAIDAINPFDPCFADACARGITTVLSSPGSANPAGGSILALKTVGTLVDDMAIRTVGLKFALGENPKTVYDGRDETPVTRMATAAILREGLQKAVRYRTDCAAAEQDVELSLPDYDSKCEALLPVLDGTQQAWFHCHRADDMATALRIAKEFGLRPVLIHGTEGYLIADALAREQVPIVVGPLIGTRCKPELQKQTLRNAGLLKAAGVEIAICTDHPEVPIAYLPASATMAVKGGLALADALWACTAGAAEIAGIADRVGRIRVGLDADLQLYAPNVSALALDTEPDWVMIDGTIVSKGGVS